MLFQIPFLKRAAATAPDLHYYSSASPTIKAMFVEGHATAALAVVEPNGYVRVKPNPIVKRNADNTPISILINGSDTELAPCIAGPEIFDHFICVCTRRAAPPCAFRGVPLTEAQFEGSGIPYAPNTHLFSIPRSLPIGNGKDCIEGDIYDNGVVDSFEHEYGEAYGMWLRVVRESANPANAQAAEFIYRKALEDDSLVTLLGPLSVGVSTTPGAASVYVAAINSTSHPDEFAEMQSRSGPYVSTAQPTAGGVATNGPTVPPPAASATTATPAGAPPGQWVADFAAALTTSNNSRETSRLTRGYVRSQSMFMAGVMSLQDATLTSLVLPTPTNAYADANTMSTLEERTDSLKRIADTANDSRPPGEIVSIVAARCMPHHDIQLCRQILLGNWNQAPIQQLSDRPVSITIFQFLPLNHDDAALLRREHEEGEIDEILNADTQGTRPRRITLIAPTKIYGIESVKKMIANFVVLSESLWVSSEGEANTPMLSRILRAVFAYLHETDFVDYYVKLSRDDRDNFVYHLLTRLDKMVAKIARAANEFSTLNAVKLERADAINITAFRTAVIAFAEDFRHIRRTVDRGLKFDPANTLKPQAPAKPAANQAQVPPAKKQRSDDHGATQSAPRGYPAVAAAAAASAAAAGAAPHGARGVVNGPPSGFGRTNDGGRNAWAPALGAPRPFNPEHGKARGDLVARDGFTDVLASMVAEKYCANFAVVGRACGRPECTKFHLGYVKWSANEQSAQIAHVEANHAKLAFNASTVKNLPADKAFLLADPATASGM